MNKNQIDKPKRPKDNNINYPVIMYFFIILAVANAFFAGQAFKEKRDLELVAHLLAMGWCIYNLFT